jgi:branched-chain amino acid transport system substrate-binding protein
MNHVRRLAVLAVTAASLGVIAACGTRVADTKTAPSSTAQPSRSATTAAQRTPIQLGALGVINDAVAGNGGSSWRDVDLAWAKEVNSQGGIDGHPIVMNIGDEQNSSTTAAAVVKDLVENKHVVAIVGSNSFQIDNITPYLESKGIPVIGGDGNGLPGTGPSPVVFPIAAVKPTPGYFFGRIANDAGGPNIGIIYCAESPLCTNALHELDNDKTGVQSGGGKPIYTAQVSLAQPDFTGECIAAQQKRVKLLLILLDASGVNRVATSCARQGYTPLYASGILDDSAGTADPNLNGHFVEGSNVFGWMQADTPAQVAYQSLTTKYNVARTIVSAQSYASTQMFVRVLRDVKGPVTSAALLKALRGIKDEDLGGLISGPLTYANNTVAGDNCLTELDLKGGHFVPGNGGKPICGP